MFSYTGHDFFDPNHEHWDYTTGQFIAFDTRQLAGGSRVHANTTEAVRPPNTRDIYDVPHASPCHTLPTSDACTSLQSRSGILSCGGTSSVDDEIVHEGSQRLHVLTQTREITSDKVIVHSFIQALNLGNSVQCWTCLYPDCGPLVGFVTLKEAVSHVRSKHLREKPFSCTFCGAAFSRKQDATRHVTVMNRGKIYKCSVCNIAYSRKDYRDMHEARCISKKLT